MTVELVFQNRQRLRRIDVRYLRQITLAVLADVLATGSNGNSCSCEIGIHIVAAGRMEELNRRFLNHAGSTDVITLDYADRPGSKTKDAQTVGDIFVCVDEAIDQARQFRTTWQSELVRYVIHGILHLRGYDDLRTEARRAMKREENRLLDAMARRFPFSKLARASKNAAGK